MRESETRVKNIEKRTRQINPEALTKKIHKEVALLKKQGEQKADDPIINEIMNRNSDLKESIELMQYKLDKLVSGNNHQPSIKNHREPTSVKD